MALLGIYNIIAGNSTIYTSIWADSNSSINTGKIYVGTKGIGGSLSVINMVDKTLSDFYLIDKSGGFNESLDSENIEDLNVVV
jgi:hypothetical protein